MAAGGLIGLVPILGLKTPARLRRQDGETKQPMPIASRRRRLTYWGTFVIGSAVGALLGSSIADSLV